MSQISALPEPLRSILGGGGSAAPRPFSGTSRYATTEILQREGPDGRTIVYLARRFVPDPERFTTLREHVVGAGDRLDRIAARYFNDPEQYWQLCDANGALRPEEMEEMGRHLKITFPVDVPGPTEDA